MLKGISAKNIEEHLKLYSGYVKFTNYILDQITELSKDSAMPAVPAHAGQAGKWAYELGELHRRFSFEYNGMRNHEIYFTSFENGPSMLAPGSPLMFAIEKEWGSFDVFLARIKAVAMTRGIGWAMLYWEKEAGCLLMQWVDEQHLGHLNGLKPILALDMWEHSFVADYQPSGKKQYVEDYFSNLNWDFVENNFEALK